MNKEVWKPVKHYENYYEISNYGNFRSKDRLVKYKDGRERVHKGQIVLPYEHKNGYLAVRIKFNGKVKCFFIHRLVALHFVKNSNPKKLTDVDHKDNNKLNNYYENLQWMTRSNNVNKKIIDGVARTVIGHRKIDFKIAEEIRNKKAKGISTLELSTEYKVSKSTILRVINNESWYKDNYKNEKVFINKKVID